MVSIHDAKRFFVRLYTFPAEQPRIIQLLVEWIDVGTHGLKIRLRLNGLNSIVQELSGIGTENRRPACSKSSPSRSRFRSSFAVAAAGRMSLLPTARRPSRPRIDSAMVRALARAFRCRKLSQTIAYGTIEEIANAEKINPSYVSRVLRMTLLAREIIESVLAGRRPETLTLASVI
jgi:hypothetical protein